MGRHVDALRACEASELCLHVAQVDLDSESAGPAGAFVPGDTGKREGVHMDGQDAEGLLREVPPECAGVLLNSIRFWKTPVAHAVTASRTAMDYTKWQQALDAAEKADDAAGRPLRAARLRLSASSGATAGRKGLLLLAPPLVALGLVYFASLVALFISSFWTVNSFTTNIEHIWNLDNFAH